MYKAMKRQRENEGIDMAERFMIFSQTREINPLFRSLPPQEFECKTCNRKFTSFQALGGHRASHKRPKLDGEEELKAQAKSMGLGIGNNKPNKMHECSICGQEFSLGQALGGHMRKHRAAIDQESSSTNQVVIANVPVLKTSSSTTVFCLDLNLTPLENDLKLLFGNMAPQVN